MESGWHLLFYGKEKVMPKMNRNDQAATLRSDQFEAILAELTPVIRAVIQTARYTAARITEVLSLKWENIFEATVVIPKAVTKKKMATRSIPMAPPLVRELHAWRAAWETHYKREPNKSDHLFPGRMDMTKHMTRQNVDHALRVACDKLAIRGVSTHSCRRSALTSMSDKGTPTRWIQSISGHSSLEMLQRYLDVKDEQKQAAVLAIG